MNCVYKQCPATLYSADQLHYSILSHETLHHCVSCNSNLENGDRKQGHLLCYCSSCKSTLTILLGERAHSAIDNSRVRYLKSDYRIAGKFGGDLNLAVGVETAKLKSANIMLAVPTMRKT